MEEVQQWKNELLNQRRLTMERRLDRAEQKRQLQLQIIVRKAHEEETKVICSCILKLLASHVSMWFQYLNIVLTKSQKENLFQM